ncbi:hypothetical protein C8R44DRAFT_753140 [Mycena epipterygia]|nr:hypothetical protein C8R44DRAFT_753140 [Mycena epipterygia]
MALMFATIYMLLLLLCNRKHSSPLKFATTPLLLSVGSSLASLHMLAASIEAGGTSTLSSLHSCPIEEIWDPFFTCAESLGPNNCGLPSSDMRDLIFFLKKKSGDADAAAASPGSFTMLDLTLLHQPASGWQIWMPEAEIDKPVKNIAQ